ncbi:MAG TPA: hypothetical protein VGC45_03445 [Gryllotalpicola sp.]
MARRSSPRVPLPPSLGAAFSAADARSAEVGRGRLQGRDVTHPFHGVIARGESPHLAARCQALSVRMTGRWYFSHVTAAVLYRIPLPRQLERGDRPLDVCMLAPRTPPTAAGCRGHSISDQKTRVLRSPTHPIVGPADVWCQLAPALSAEDLVAAGDYLLSGNPLDGAGRHPLCTLDELHEAFSRHRGKRGAKKLRWALGRVRTGVDSRPETILRLMLIAAGLPEPLIGDPTPVDAGRLLLHPDLTLKEWGVVFEYEGDGHRDRDRWLSDVQRYSWLRAAGWEVIQVTSDDLFRTPDAFLRRVFEVLRRRGYRS